jgi:hypothetical protein
VLFAVVPLIAMLLLFSFKVVVMLMTFVAAGVFLCSPNGLQLAPAIAPELRVRCAKTLGFEVTGRDDVYGQSKLR